MAISLGSIVVELLANTGGFITGMDKAGYSAKKVTKEIHQSFDQMGEKIGSSLQSAFASLGQFGSVVGELSRKIGESFDGIGAGSSGIAVAVGALGALGAAAIAAGAGFIELAKGGAEVVEHLSHISEKTGIGVRDLQIFQAAGATVGVSLDDMTVGMRRFDQALMGFGKGAAAQSILRELGVTAKDNKTALLQVSDAFSKMQDPVRRANDAVALFGRSGLNMIPLLMKGRDGILEWEKTVDALGPKIGKDAVAANEAYRRSVEEMSLSWDRFKVKAEEALTPALAKATSWFAKLNFESLLAGGMGVGDVFKDQTAAQQASTEEAKKQSAVQDELLRKGEQLELSLEKKFQIEKDGGQAGYALDQKRQELNDAIANHRWKDASAAQALLPALQKAADLEALRLVHAKQLAASYASLQESFAKGGASPLLKIPKSDPTAGIEALFGPQTKDPLAGAPDLGNPLAGMDFSKGLSLLDDNLNSGQKYITDFNDKWKAQSHGTEKSIHADYDAQLAKLQGFLALGEVSEKQAKDVFLKIQQERFDGLKQLREQNGTSTFKDAWTDLFSQLANSGRDFARSITADIGNAIESLNSQLVQFVATGKGLSLKKIGQDLQANLFGSLLKKGESSLLSAFGLGSTTKPDGSRNNALWVQFANVGGLSAAGAGALPLGNIASMFGFGGSTTTGKTTPGSSSGSLFGSGGIGGFFSSLLGLLPHFAGGGDTQPGRAYVVGEKRPELFVPRSAGTIVPRVPSTDGKTQVNNVTNHFHNVTDMDSFRKSGTQISRHIGRSVQVASSRG